MMITEKIQTREVIARLLQEARLAGKRIGFTSGAFDLLHAGHIDYLEKAKALCDLLVVGVNSDASVRRYKGDDRPIVPEDQRIKVVAALEAVDLAFLFDERRNQQNIEILRPDLYIKAGDYAKSALTSSGAVEAYGGRVALIPVVEEASSTKLIERVAALHGLGGKQWQREGGAEHMEIRPAKSSPAIFLDRDGTINEEINYLHEPERFRLLPGVIEGLKAFRDMGYRLVIITNQPGIGMGYYTKEDFYRVNLKMLGLFSEAGILIDKIYFCPHSKADQCDCRKPGQLLVDRAVEALNIDVKRSVFIGDRPSDVETGERAGMRTVLIAGSGTRDLRQKRTPSKVVSDLCEAASWLLEGERKKG